MRREESTRISLGMSRAVTQTIWHLPLFLYWSSHFLQGCLRRLFALQSSDNAPIALKTVTMSPTS